MSCPICGLRLPQSELAVHVERHFDEAATDQLGPTASTTVRCAACGMSVLASELDSHELAHAMQREADTEVVDLTRDDDDYQPPAPRASSAGPAERERERDRLLWPRIPLRELAARQKTEPPSGGGDGYGGSVEYHSLLRAALEKQATTKSAGHFRAALCGAPLPFFATLDGHDGGFGCGWRNLQMLCGHLLGAPGDTGAAARAALFAGAGFVPDVPSLQAWLETAWGQGFDPEGAAQLGHAVQGKRTWIGVADVAALLRSFGVRARLVNFKAAPRTGPAGLARHAGVECDLCAALPILGARHSSTVRANYDLCSSCVAKPEAQRFAPFRKVESPVHYGEEQCEPGAHKELVDWLWRYFVSDSTGKPLPMGLGSQITVSPSRSPLFLQHDGHSRTVVGVERRPAPGGGSEEVLLLILDPSSRPAELRAQLAAGTGWQRLVKRGLQTLRKCEYSLLVLDEPLLAAGGEAGRLALRELEVAPSSRALQPSGAEMGGP